MWGKRRKLKTKGNSSKIIEFSDWQECSAQSEYVLVTRFLPCEFLKISCTCYRKLRNLRVANFQKISFLKHLLGNEFWKMWTPQKSLRSSGKYVKHSEVEGFHSVQKIKDIDNNKKKLQIVIHLRDGKNLRARK